MKKESIILTIAVFNLLFVSQIFSQIPFAAHTIIGGGFLLNKPVSVYAIDIDGDADMDVLRASNWDNKIAWYENLTPVSIGNNDQTDIPVNFQLYNNYPNPFNPVTHIEFDVKRNSRVFLKVFDLHGREIKTLVNERIPAGHYSQTFNAKDLASGIYFYQIRMGDFYGVKKMILIQ